MKYLCKRQSKNIDRPIAGIRIDRDTHQITSENRECFACQWRATPERVTKVGGLQRYANPQILLTRSFITSPPGFTIGRRQPTRAFFFTKTTYTTIKGKLPEWSNGPHSKCGDRVTGPGVRIPHFPQKAEGRQDLRLKKRNSAEFLFAYASMRLEFTQKLERGGCKKNCGSAKNQWG